jgi:hypothetical protein
MKSLELPCSSGKKVDIACTIDDPVSPLEDASLDPWHCARLASGARDRCWAARTVALLGTEANDRGPINSEFADRASQHVSPTMMRAFVACRLSQKNGVLPYRHYK